MKTIKKLRIRMRERKIRRRRIRKITRRRIRKITRMIIWEQTGHLFRVCRWLRKLQRLLTLLTPVVLLAFFASAPFLSSMHPQVSSVCPKVLFEYIRILFKCTKVIFKCIKVSFKGLIVYRSLEQIGRIMEEY